MGGRGAFSERGVLQWHDYKSIGTIDGVKVLSRTDGKEIHKLPEISKTPNTSYMRLRKDGSFRELRVYGDDREVKFELALHHEKRKGMWLHVHDSKSLKGNERDKGRELTSEELKKYSRLLRKTGMKV